MDPGVKVSGVGKQYRLYHANRPTTLQSAVISGFRRVRPREKFWAVRNLSFECPFGKAIGIVGRNGAGKSTLLRLVSGVIKADEGEIGVGGKIGGLLGVGVGFHSELTGRENALVSGVITGMTMRQVHERMEDIFDFAELDDVIDDPLRTYSSGMRMRLGFSVVAHTEPEIVLIDEVLAVGDMQFQQKCYDRIQKFKADSCAILLVSHNHDQIRRICDEAIWLEKGEAVRKGPVETVLDEYAAAMVSPAT